MERFKTMFRRSDSPAWPRSQGESRWSRVPVPRLERTRQSSPYRYVEREPSVSDSPPAPRATRRQLGPQPPSGLVPSSPLLTQSSGSSERSLSSSDSRSSSRSSSSPLMHASGSSERSLSSADSYPRGSSSPGNNRRPVPTRRSRSEASLERLPSSNRPAETLSVPSASPFEDFSRSLEEAVEASRVLRSKPWLLDKYKRCGQENLAPCQPSLCTSTTDMFGEELDFQRGCIALPVSSGNQSCYRPGDLAKAWTSHAELSLESSRRPDFEVTDPNTGAKYCQDGTTFLDASTHRALSSARPLFRRQALQERSPQRTSAARGTQGSFDTLPAPGRSEPGLPEGGQDMRPPVSVAPLDAAPPSSLTVSLPPTSMRNAPAYRRGSIGDRATTSPTASPTDPRHQRRATRSRSRRRES